jgi:hypothetical protein
MSTLLYALNRGPVDAPAEEVRSTVTIVDHDEAASEQPHSTDFNETFTDPVTDGGLTSRQLASHVVPSMRYVPHIGNANDNLSNRIDDQISPSGAAAAREAAGEWGHGTLKIVEGIEPTIRDGGALGSNYFATYPRPLSGSGSFMTPAQVADPASEAAAQSGAEINSRKAVQGSQYAAYYAAIMGVNP